MKYDDVTLGSVYLTRIGANLRKVRVEDRVTTLAGRRKFAVTALSTGKRLKPRSAAALHALPAITREDAQQVGLIVTDEQGSQRGKCVSCGDECSARPHTSSPMNLCGDCNSVVCSACSDGTRATRCKACAEKYSADFPDPECLGAGVECPCGADHGDSDDRNEWNHS